MMILLHGLSALREEVFQPDVVLFYESFDPSTPWLKRGGCSFWQIIAYGLPKYILRHLTECLFRNTLPSSLRFLEPLYQAFLEGTFDGTGMQLLLTRSGRSSLVGLSHSKSVLHLQPNTDIRDTDAEFHCSFLLAMRFGIFYSLQFEFQWIGFPYSCCACCGRRGVKPMVRLYLQQHNTSRYWKQALSSPVNFKREFFYSNSIFMHELHHINIDVAYI